MTKRLNVPASLARKISFGCCKALLLATTLVGAANATTIIEQDGNSGGVVPLNFGAIGDSGAYAVEWTQIYGFTDVTVSATLFENYGAGVNYWLADSLNAATQHTIASGSATVSGNPSSVNLFQLASLGPGTYFLILQSSGPNGGWLYSYPSGASDTEANGVTYDGEFLASSNNSGFVPTDSFGSRHYHTEFAVTGATAPEPANLGIVFLGLIGLMFWRRVKV